MPSEIVLDDERFIEIAERAKEQIARIYPAWTDYNLHDPGITVLELFAWLKEAQQFHMDQIGEAHRLAYLRLMGVEPAKKKAARAVVRIDGAERPVFLPKGSRFFAGEVCFEALTEVCVCPEEITELSVLKKGSELHRIRNDGEHEMAFPVFGETPDTETLLRMEISGPIKPHAAHSLSVRLAKRGDVRRNPIGEDSVFYPLAELSLWYRGAHGMCRAEIVEDTTHGLLEDGWLRFFLEDEMESTEGVYYLELKPDRCEYEMPPLIAGISLKEQNAVQQRTIAEYHDGAVCAKEPVCLTTYLAMTGEFLLFRREEDCYVLYEGRVEKRIGDEGAFFFFPALSDHEELAYRIVCYEAGGGETLRIGEGNGLPDQEYRPEISGLCAEGMSLMMEQSPGSGRYVSVEQCEDLMQADAHDAVFRYDEKSGCLCFGDCEHGRAPEGSILFAAARSSLGKEGNVKAGSICRIEDGERRLYASNRYAAAGGKDTETVEECAKRLQMMREQPVRAVTEQDFESLVRRTPGLMIESVRVLSALTECVTLIVKPYSAQIKADLSEAYRKNILRMLEPGRLIGTRILVLAPEYIGIFLYAEIMAGGQEQAARVRMEEALAGYFGRIRSQFGVSVRVSAIYEILDVLDVTTEILSLTLDAQGKNIRRSRNGDLILPANGLAYLKECVLSISTDR